MVPADSTRQPHRVDFEREALPFLPNVARFARLLTRDPADADDLAQETFLRAYQSWHTYMPDTDCRRWLITICRNIFLRDRQRSQRFVAMDDPDADLEATRELYRRAMARGLKDLFDRIDLGPAIERSIHALPPEYRDVALLVDVEDYTYAHAAEALGIPVGTVRSRLFRARRLLQQALLEHARDHGIGQPPDIRDAGEGTAA
jgi:RNA polymerase sigma-70 factor, ECF subfamily